MKKAVFYSLCTVGIAVILVLCYYLSYRFALKEFNHNTYEQKKSNMDFTIQDVVTKEEVTVSSDTVYKLKNYNLSTGKTTIKELPVPGEFIGLTRNELNEYFNKYMQEIPLEEYNKGLAAYQLESFSGSQIVVKKTYNSEAVIYKYYLCNCDNELIIYYSDKKTIYENTRIQVSELPETEQTKLNYGIYIKDEDELYGVLENYTS